MSFWSARIEQPYHGRLTATKPPELLWSNPHLEALHARLEGDYEIIERAKALERKLSTLSRTAETLLETVRYKSSHRVEWYIVGLIVIELLLSLYGHFPR